MKRIDKIGIVFIVLFDITFFTWLYFVFSVGSLAFNSLLFALDVVLFIAICYCLEMSTNPTKKKPKLKSVLKKIYDPNWV